MNLHIFRLPMIPRSNKRLYKCSICPYVDIRDFWGIIEHLPVGGCIHGRWIQKFSVRRGFQRISNPIFADFNSNVEYTIQQQSLYFIYTYNVSADTTWFLSIFISTDLIFISTIYIHIWVNGYMAQFSKSWKVNNNLMVAT